MTTRYRKNSNYLIQREIGDEFVIVHRDNGNVHQLNPVGACIWRNLAQYSDVVSLAEILVQEFEIDTDTAMRDVNGFVSELSRLQLIEAMD